MRRRTSVGTSGGPTCGDLRHQLCPRDGWPEPWESLPSHLRRKEQEMLVNYAVDAGIIGTGYGDNSGLRARLSGRKPEYREVESQLRSYMLEREEQASRTRRGRKRKR